MLIRHAGDSRQRSSTSALTAARVVDIAQTIVDGQRATSALHLRQKGQRQIYAGSLADQLTVVQVSALAYCRRC
jgi:hypothetical protein